MLQRKNFLDKYKDLFIKISMPNHQKLSLHICNWFQKNARVLPWRSQATAYQVWISEIMLQQTQVKVVLNYYQRFIQVFPDIEALAKADLDRVLGLWSGLGYYSRARNMHKCAQLLVQTYNSEFPEDYKKLLKLPGIGPYTAAAIASFAFHKKQAVVDGNVKRVLSRIFLIKGASASSSFNNTLNLHLNALLDNTEQSHQAYILSEAIMELGALICTPKNVKCEICPIQKNCQSFQTQQQHLFPEPKVRKQRKKLQLVTLCIQNPNGDLWLEQRSKKGLFGGLYEMPNQKFDAQSEIYPTARSLLQQRKLAKEHRSNLSVTTVVTRKLSHLELEFHLIRLQSSLPSAHWKSGTEQQHIGISGAMKALMKALKTL